MAGGDSVLVNSYVTALRVDVPADSVDPHSEMVTTLLANYRDMTGAIWEVRIAMDEREDFEDTFEQVSSPTIFTMTYTTDSDGEPIGVAGILRALEIEYAKARDASDSRTKRIAGGSMLINKDLLNRGNDGDALFANKIITVQGAVDESSIRYVPSGADELPALGDREDRIIREAEMLTGLRDYRPPEGTQNQTATAALQDYESSVARFTDMQDGWVDIYAPLLELVARRSYNHVVEAFKAQSPLDAKRREVGIELLLPQVMAIAEKDPLGNVYGLSGAAAVRDLMSQEAGEFKLDRAIFDKHWATTSEDLAERQKVMAEQQAEAQSKMDAATLAAEGQKMAGEAALLTAQTNASTAQSEVDIKTGVAVRESQVRANEDDIKKFEVVNKARTDSKRLTLEVAQFLQGITDEDRARLGPALKQLEGVIDEAATDDLAEPASLVGGDGEGT